MTLVLLNRLNTTDSLLGYINKAKNDSEKINIFFVQQMFNHACTSSRKQGVDVKGGKGLI